MQPVRTSHPLIRYLSLRFKYGPLPNGLPTFFYVLYGQTRSGPSGYEVRASSVLSGNVLRAAEKWRNFLAHSKTAANWTERGLLFKPPTEWPPGWPEDWPEWVAPVYLLRAFGGPNGCSNTKMNQPLKRWTARAGMPELFSYVYGVPLNREELVQARRGARQLLNAPQFLVWAYNVPVWNYPRTDVNALVRERAMAQLTRDPLATEDEHVCQALPGWLLDPVQLKRKAGVFQPLRTRARDLVRYDDDELLGWRGDHLKDLKDPKPEQTRTNFELKLAKNRAPLYLTQHLARFR